jgi:hypothetical protein
MCENTYADLVAIDWTPDGECWCQDDCQCMEDADDGDIHLITSSAVAALPNTCVSACPAEEAAFEDCLSKQGIAGTMVSGLSGESAWCVDSVTFHYWDGRSTKFGQSGGGSVPRVDIDSTSEYVSGLVQYGGCEAYGYMGGGFEFIVKSIATGATRTISIAGGGRSSSVLAEFHVDWPCRIIGFETSPGDTYDLQPTVTSVQTDCTTADDVDDDDDDYDDDDDFVPRTCDDGQQWLSKPGGVCQDGPAVCRAEYEAYAVCYYEDQARDELGLACDFTCSASSDSKKRNNAELLIIIIVCSVAAVCCLLALGTAAAFGAFGSCACFAKKKKMRVAEPSEPPLAHATVIAGAPPPAKTQAHMTEGPPSPGPPPLAPIKATETLAAERP